MAPHSSFYTDWATAQTDYKVHFPPIIKPNTSSRAAPTGVADQFQRGGKLPYMTWILPNALENRDAMEQAWYTPTAFSLFASSRPELEEAEDEDGMLESVAYVESLIDACVSKGIPENRIVLGGFSQGCAMSLLTSLTSKKYAGKLAGIAGLMGYLPLGDKIQELRAHAGLPPHVGEISTFLAKGQKDQLIPRRVWNQSLKGLKQLGMEEYPEGSMEINEYEGVGHGLTGAVLRDLCMWLEKIVPSLED